MKRIYYGWYIVAYAVACSMLMTGATLSSFGLYVLPVSSEFNLSRANINTVMVLLNLGGACVAPLTGWILDRFPLRRLIVIGSILTTVAFTILSQSHSLILSALTIGVVLTAASSMSVQPGGVLIVRWFKAHRGRALTFGAFGLSLASIVVVPLVSQLIQHFGWRTSLLISGLTISAVVLIPALLLRIKPSVAEMEREGLGREELAASYHVAEIPPLSIGAVIRMPQFWCIGIAIAIPMAVSQSVLVSMVPMAMSHGVLVTQAATLVSVSGLMAISSKIALSFFADRINRSLLLAAVFCIGAIENVVLFIVASSAPFPILLICAGIQGLSSGILMPVWTALVAERFGARSYATVFGLMYPIILVMCAILVRFTGEVFDRTGGYHGAFATFVGMEILAAILMFSVRFTRPVKPMDVDRCSRQDLPDGAVRLKPQ